MNYSKEFSFDIVLLKLQVYIIEAANPSGGLQKIRERVSGVQYFLEHHHGVFYILTNAPLCGNKEWSGENYYLARCPVEDIQSVNWQVRFVPHFKIDLRAFHIVISKFI